MYENQVRAEWKTGAQCQIWSNSERKWFPGEVAQIFTDEQGEWLEVGWLEVRYDCWMRKQVQRYGSDIRPYPSDLKKPKEHKDEEMKLRQSWGKGDEVEIFSNTHREWYLGKINGICMDYRGEWLTCVWAGSNGEAMSKQVYRFSTGVRPVHVSSGFEISQWIVIAEYMCKQCNLHCGFMFHSKMDENLYPLIATYLTHYTPFTKEERDQTIQAEAVKIRQRPIRMRNIAPFLPPPLYNPKVMPLSQDDHKEHRVISNFECTWTEGDRCQIYSVTDLKWLDGEIVYKFDNWVDVDGEQERVAVVYSGSTKTKQVYRYSSIIRPHPDDTEKWRKDAQIRRSWEKGDNVEIYSKTHKDWLWGEIVDIHNDDSKELLNCVCTKLPDGVTISKQLKRNSMFIRALPYERW